MTAKTMVPTAMSKQALKAALGIVGICMPRPQTVEIEHSGSITVIDRDPTQRPADYNSKRRKSAG